MQRRLLSMTRLSFPFASAIAALLAAPSSHAQTTRYWDGNNDTANFGNASGIWAAPTTGTATAGWTTDATGAAAISGNSITTATNDALNFGTGTTSRGLGGGTITVSGVVDAASLTFGSQTTGNITLAGGTINLGATASISVGAGSTTVQTITSEITGAGTSLTKTGNTLALSGTNNYSGATNITAGTLIYRNTGAKSAASTHTFSAGTTLGMGVATTGAFFTSTDIDNAFAGIMTDNLGNVVVAANTRVGIDTTAGNFTYATSVAGSPTRGLIKFGANTLTLTGDNTYTGPTNILGGTLRLENTAAMAATSSVLVGSGTVLSLATDTSITAPAPITLQGGTVSSDRLTAGEGITHAFGNTVVNNAVQSFTRGTNANDGTAVIQLGSVTNASGANGTATFNPTTANLIIAGGYTGVTNAGLNTLTFGGTASTNSMTGDITLGSRTNVNITKSGTSVWTLSGTHGTLGTGSTTTISAGALITTRLAALPNSGAVTISGGTLGVVMGTSPANWSTAEVDTLLSTATKTSGALGIDTTNSSLPQWTDFTATNLGALGLTKLGLNTLALNSAGNNYTGATTIGQGTVRLEVDHTLGGPLNFGFGNGTNSAVGTLDLASTNVNATFGGLNVLTNSTVANTITIGSGRTLTLTASPVANVVSVGGVSATAISSKLQVTGAGTLTVNDATRNIVVANLAPASVTAAPSTAELDLSGLGTFNATINNLYVGRPTTAAGAASTAGRPYSDTLILAGNNTITASGVISVGGANSSTGQSAATPSRLLLGASNVLNAASFVLGSSRTSGTMGFINILTNPAAIIRGAEGLDSRTNLYLGDQGNTRGVSANPGGSTTTLGTMNFTSGAVDARIDNLLVGLGGGVTSNVRARGNGTFIIDGASSNVDVNTLVIGQTLANDTNGTGGTSSIGTFTVTNGTLQVNTAITIANDIDTTATTNGTVNVQGTFAVAGGTANIGSGSIPVSLILGNHAAAGNPGLATATVNLTGGTVNVFGDIREGDPGAGSITSSLILDGATLDLKGNRLGTSGALIDTLTLASGTLRNVAGINDGGGPVKTGPGALLLTGTISYSGDTTVTEGTLTLGSSAGPLNANPANDASTVTLAATGATLDLVFTGTDRVDKLVVGNTQLAAGVYGRTGSAAPVIGLPQITGDGTLTVATGPGTSGFAIWITGSFANGTVPLGQQGPNADFDRDGVPNLLEYAIDGEDPTVANATLGSLNGLSLSYPKRPGTTGLTYAIQGSTDLGTPTAWTEVSGGGYVNNATTLSFLLTPPTPVRNFLRLRVVQVP